MVNVKQIIRYGVRTTEKEPTVLRQHMLIRFGLLHLDNKTKPYKKNERRRELQRKTGGGT